MKARSGAYIWRSTLAFGATSTALQTSLAFIIAHVVSGIRAPKGNFLMQLSPGGSAGQGFLQEVIKLRPLVMHAGHPQMARKRQVVPGAPPWLVNLYPSGSCSWRSACSEPVFDTCRTYLAHRQGHLRPLEATRGRLRLKDKDQLVSRPRNRSKYEPWPFLALRSTESQHAQMSCRLHAYGDVGLSQSRPIG